MHLSNIIKHYQHNNNYIIIVLSFIFLSLLSVFLIFNTSSMYSGADLLFHLKRIMELKESVLNGVLFPKYSFNQFHGSAVMLLYPYINLFPIILLSIFIKSKVLDIYIWIILNVFLSLNISFFSSKPFSKSISVSYLFSVIYSMSSVFTSYIFYDCDFGIITTLAFLPLIIFGFLRFINDNRWLELSTGIILIMYSHVLSILIIVNFLIIWLIPNYNVINKLKIKSFFKMMFLIIFTTSIVWLPAMYFSLFNLGNVNPVSFSFLHGNSTYNLLKTGIEGHVTYELSFFAIIGIFLPIILYKKLGRYVRQMYFISLLYIIICSKLFPWKIISKIKLINIFQFSWRFYIIPQILLCYIFSICLLKITNSHKVVNILTFICVIIAVILQLHCQNDIVKLSVKSPILNTKYILRRKDLLFHIQHINYLSRPLYKVRSSQFTNLSRLDGNGSISFGDYYPKSSVTKIRYINDNLGYFKNGSTVPIYNLGYNKFYFYCTKYTHNRMYLPIVKYNNEKIILYINHKKRNSTVNKNNLISINNLNRGRNTIYLKYCPNLVIVSICMIMMIVGIYIYIIKIYKRLV